MKKILYVLNTVLIAGLFTGCSDDDIVSDGGARPTTGAKVNFTLSDASTRLAYDDENDLQINWTGGEKVRIYCAEAEDVKDAEYTVVGSIVDGQEHTGKLQYNENGLAWGGDQEHHFFAVYPADKETVTVNNGIATFQINQNQVCTFPAEATNGNYKGNPDMTNAYMVASKSTGLTDNVELSFRPIMTTLEITVRSTGGNNERGITVSGLTIFNNNWKRDATFQYDINNKSIVSSTATTQQSIYVEVHQEGAEEGEEGFIDLAANESITFTVFLPPMDINAENQILVRPNVSNTSGTGAYEMSIHVGGQQTEQGTLEYAASSKGELTLPVWPSDEVTGNNWITPLDGSIYVQQLSIPGTHDAAAYTTTILDAGRTQALTLEAQWNMGIRAFDLRAAYSRFKGTMWLYHGLTRTEISLDEALSALSNLVDSNPGEFAIIQLRHEYDSSDDLLLDKDSRRWNRVYDVLNAYSSNIVTWKNDLTIDDCRGSLVILTRDDYDGRSKAGLISDWPDNTSGIAKINSSTNYYVQDYYKYAGAFQNDDEGAEKISQFNALLSVTSKFNDSSSDDFVNKSWALNHASGYAGSIGGTNQYMKNAQYIVPTLYRTISNQETPGPTGIVFMDYVGQRWSPSWGGLDSFVMYGDMLPQAIINNNYRYTMLRKTN